MVVTKRQTTGENYEDVKQPTQTSNGQIFKVPQTTNQERYSDRKCTFRTISHIARLSFYALHCLVTAIAVLCLLGFLSPFLVVFNVLRIMEKKWAQFNISSTEAMTGQDALWMQDSEKNRMIVHSVMVLEGVNDGTVDRLRTVIERCVAMRNEAGELAYSRFTKHFRRGIFQYFLEETVNFDIAHHVIEYEDETPKSKEDMEALLSRLSSEDLRFDIPPWRFIVIRKGYADNEALVLFRMHHSLADGVSLTRFLAHVLPDNEVPIRPLVKVSMFDRMLMNIKALLVGPKIVLEKLLTAADRSILHGSKIKGVKRVSWSEPIDLQIIKRIKNQTGTTVNDVMMACLSRSFNNYFKSKGITAPPYLTASVPVNVRFEEKEFKFENNFAIVSLKLPVSEKNILQQLYSTKENMDTVKYSGEAFIMAAAASYTVEYIPAFLTNLWNKPIANIHSLVLSNVVGPAITLIIGGQKVKDLFFWPPQRDLVGIGVGMYSYAGKVTIGVQSDVNCLCEPKAIVKAFQANIVEMEKHVFNSTSQTEVDSGIESH